MTPPVLAGFTYIRRLGSGGFADVLLYEQQWPRQRVAVKVVRPDIDLSAHDKDLFRSEADAMARLADHPYIVNVLNAGETTDGRLYLVMRYCPPPDLGARIRREPLAVPDALSTGVKLASAVETAHRWGILHRDIKPSNVLITTYGEPALTDFGIAARMQDLESDDSIRLSFPWAPPELIEGRSQGSVATDVYSLGATIWNLLVGHSPFIGADSDTTEQALVARILHEPPPPTGGDDVPADLELLLRRCLAKDPYERPGSALDLARGLQRIEDSLGLARTPVAVEDIRGYAAGDGARNPDATRVKPIGVVHGQAHTTTLDPGQPVEAADTIGGRSDRGQHQVWAWSLVGMAVAVALLVVLVMHGRGAGPSAPAAVPTSSSTPAPVAQSTLQKPEVTARRVGKQIRFDWTQPGGRTGDSWFWQSASDARRNGHTDRRSVALPGKGGQVCIIVSLVRDGDTSDPVKACAR